MASYLFAQPFLYYSQGVAFFILSVFLWFFYQDYNRQYVKLWLIAFSALGLSHIVFAIELTVIDIPNYTWQELTLTTIHKTLFYLFVLYFLKGLYVVKCKRKITRYSWLFTLIIVFIAIISTALFAFDPLAVFNRFYLRESLPAFIFGCAFVSASILLSLHTPRFFSSKLMSVLTLVVGIRYLFFSFSSVIFLSESVFVEIIKLLPYWDVASQSVLGFSALVWLQRSERRIALSAMSRAQYLGKHDSLTGVYNREQVIDKMPELIEKCTKESTKLAVFIIDIKRFKYINDNYGLRAGDYILGEIADRLKESVLVPKIVGRLSGDSFVFVLNVYDNNEVSQAVEHLHELVEQNYIFDSNVIELQSRVGFSLYPDHGDDAEELLQKSSMALFHKESRELATVVYVDGMQAYEKQLILIEKEFRQALIKEELVLYYQPQLNLQTNRIEGVEALIRWQHPEKGLLYPNDFLPHVDALNLNGLLDEYVLQHACKQIAQWIETYQRKICVAVNISAYEFQNNKLVARIQSLLFQYHIPAQYLELEITENIVISDIESAMNTITKLQNMGIKISIDDFGTGYSSLTYLRDLPIDKIKIDRSFIQFMEHNDADVTIVKAMINLCQGLGKRVLAEGVETEGQLEFLRSLGCDAIQGYYVAKPLTEEKLANYLRRK